MFNIGPLELMVIMIIALLVVGPKRLPEVGKSIGRGLREFRRAQEEVRETFRFDLDDDDSEPPASPPVENAPSDPVVPEAPAPQEPPQPAPSTEAE